MTDVMLSAFEKVQPCCAKCGSSLTADFDEDYEQASRPYLEDRTMVCGVCGTSQTVRFGRRVVDVKEHS